MEIEKSKPLFQLTVGEFLELQRQERCSTQPALATEKRYVYSLAALASELGCCVATVQKLKNSGKIPYKQAGRKVIFDVDAVLNAIEKNK